MSFFLVSGFVRYIVSLCLCLPHKFHSWYLCEQNQANCNSLQSQYSASFTESENILVNVCTRYSIHIIVFTKFPMIHAIDTLDVQFHLGIIGQDLLVRSSNVILLLAPIIMRFHTGHQLSKVLEDHTETENIRNVLWNARKIGEFKNRYWSG